MKEEIVITLRVPDEAIRNDIKDFMKKITHDVSRNQTKDFYSSKNIFASVAIRKID